MLCGEFHKAPLGLITTTTTISDYCNPYTSLLTLIQSMATITAQQQLEQHERQQHQQQDDDIDDDIYLGMKKHVKNTTINTTNINNVVEINSNFPENGLLSYENPNYHLDPTRLDDAINSNTNLFIDDDDDDDDDDDIDDNNDMLYQQLDDMCNIGHNNIKNNQNQNSGHGRKSYATLDIGTMGVDINTGPLAHINSTNINDNKRNIERNGNLLENTENFRTIRDNITEKTTLLKNNNDNHQISHIPGQLNNDLYAIPIKKKATPTTKQQKDEQEKELYTPDKESSDNDLPPGWEKHEDNDGPYYWHIKSGTIQREVPIIPDNEQQTTITKNNLINKENDMLMMTFDNFIPTTTTVTRSNTSSALDLECDDRKRQKNNEMILKRRSYPTKVDQQLPLQQLQPLQQQQQQQETTQQIIKERPIRFAVRSLGWVEIAEDDLTPERSSKAVNKCIVDLSVGKNDLLDVVGRWGDGKDLFMDLDEGALKLIDPENLTVLNTQPIHTIRVWGVGRDNGRDFAYVARDRSTRKHMCHVFRCDMPARTIANTLRDICKKIMIERSLQQNLAKPIDINGRSLATRPTNLPTEHRRFTRNGQSLVTQSFPTPMEEPKKVLRAQYLGTTQVTQATGMEILNEAIDRLVTSVPPEQWQFVNVAVAPSMISIQSPTDDRLIAECRVRYLSFLGIGKVIKHCAFIMHTAQDTFVAHVFYCEPSSGALCKTIEAACKLRYQKCLDAHPQGLERNNTNLQTPGKSIGAALKSIVGSLTGRKSRSVDS